MSPVSVSPCDVVSRWIYLRPFWSLASMTLLPKRLYRGASFAAALAGLAVAGFTVRPEAQGQAPAATPPPAPINQAADPLLQSFRFRSIGPASMGGRIDDIAVSESDPNVIYLGYAVGGV